MKIRNIVLAAFAAILLVSCGNQKTTTAKSTAKTTTTVQSTKTEVKTAAPVAEKKVEPAANTVKEEKPVEAPKPIPKLVVESKDSGNPVKFNTSISSVDFAKSLTIGWNLGNTLDATSGTGLNTEISWGAPATTQEMIKGLKAGGYKTIRIPISWANHVDANNIIDEAWMARVKKIVNWAYEEGMYVIINIHHDNYSVAELPKRKGGFALSPDPVLQEKSKAYISAVWTQVAANFNNSYDEHLIFEILNEPRDMNGSIWGNEWWLNSRNAITAQNIISDYEKAGIDAIRESGGNNANRFIMVPDYAASSDYGTILNNYTMPKDNANDKLLLSVHAYTPYPFAMFDGSSKHEAFTDSDKAELSRLFSYLNTHYVKKGIGVVIGETSASNKGNLEAREAWFTYFFGQAYENGMPAILWDNMQPDPAPKESEKHGYYNRATQTWYFPNLIEASMKAVGVSKYSLPKYQGK